MKRIFKLLIVLLAFMVNITNISILPMEPDKNKDIGWMDWAKTWVSGKDSDKTNDNNDDNVEEKLKDKEVDINDSFALLDPHAEDIINNLSVNFQKLFKKVDQYFQKRSESETAESEIDNIKIAMLKGAFYYPMLLNGQLDAGNMKSDEIENIISSLIWFYFGIAIYKDQAFDSGTFFVKDPNFNIFNFLTNYKEHYPRRSSHLKGIEEYYLTGEKKQHFGLDISTLPDKHTLLFGKVKDGLIFIKPEEHGTKKLRDITLHGIDFSRSFSSKQIINAAKLTGVPEEYFKHYVTIDDSPNFRKERIPLDLLKKYSGILDQLENLNYFFDNKLKLEYSKAGDVLGIHRIYHNLNRFAENIKNKAKKNENYKKVYESILKFINELEKEYDNLSIRFGREVIITFKEFKNIVTPNDLNIIRKKLF